MDVTKFKDGIVHFRNLGVIGLTYIIVITDSIKPWGGSGNLAFRARSTVCRGPDDRAVSTQVLTLKHILRISEIGYTI